MIEKETVLILGAGASNELDFPLGKGLVASIYALLKGRSSGLKDKRLPNVTKLIDVSLDNEELIAALLSFHEEKDFFVESDRKYLVAKIRRFAEDLDKAHPDSIDQFLYLRREYEMLGKICILYVLSDFERREKFFSRVLDDGTQRSILPSQVGWYEYLWSCLSKDAVTKEDFLENKLKIITFNYDRSLEEFLMSALRAKYGMEEIDAHDCVAHLDIQHVYGKLGTLSSEFNYSGNDQRQLINNGLVFKDNGMIFTMEYQPYELRTLLRIYGDPGEYGVVPDDFERKLISTKDKQEQLAKAILHRASLIKTYYEAVVDRASFETTIQWAKRVYFLGWGYHKQNVEILNLGKSLQGEKSIWGTALNFSDREVERIKEMFDVVTGRKSCANIIARWDMGLDLNSKISSFIRNVAPLI